MKVAKYLFPALAGLFLSAGSAIGYYDFGLRTIVVYREPGCSYFIAQEAYGGYYILEWNDGYDPQPGDILLGNLSSVFADIYYPLPDRKGSVLVEHRYDSKGEAIREYYKYCGISY